jgi:hypothetical protein
MPNKWITHVKQYSKQHGISYPEAMIKARATYTPSKKLKGGQTVKQFGDDVWYNKVPEQYHSGLESLGRAGLSQMGFGLKKQKPRKKGGDLFSDIGNAFKPVAQVFKPIANFQNKNVMAIANNPLVKRIAKQVAKEVLKYGVSAAPAAAAAAATAAGQPHLAPAASLLAMSLANEAKPFGDSYIDGLGLRKRRIKRGKALVPAGHY